ncbi:connectin isoform X2 [Coccinella septempunctata]|nr:connectin isoform X2 [Coccinella septempunctata]XP_044747661.1 connectin isoform X2 [Coccinella septempunctata]
MKPVLLVLLSLHLLLVEVSTKQRSKMFKSGHQRLLLEKQLNKTDINLCDIKGNSEQIHCVCSEGWPPFNRTRAECWIFSEIARDNNVWHLFSTQPWLKSLKMMIRPEVKFFHLPKIIFTYLNKLEYLSIVYGVIEELPSYAFAESTTLAEVVLSSNHIEKLSAHCFYNMPSLTSLQLDDNKIEELHKEMFMKLPILTKLVLSRNNISIIQDGTFAHLTQLEELYLDNNRIRALNRMIFMELGHLKMLMLGSNKIRNIDDLTFEQLWEVVVLDLDQNELKFLSERAFSGLNSLEELILSNNYLTTLPHGLFADNTRIKYLNLRNNDLKTLSYNTLSPVLNNIIKHSSGDLIITDNKLVCDCHLNWVIRLYNETQWEMIKNILQAFTCTTPVKGLSQTATIPTLGSYIAGSSDSATNDGISGVRLLLKKTRHRGQRNVTVVNSPEKFECPKEERQFEIEGQMVRSAASLSDIKGTFAYNLIPIYINMFSIKLFFN